MTKKSKLKNRENNAASIAPPVAAKKDASELPKPSEHTRDTKRQPLALADLDKRLSVKRRTLSPDEKKTLLGQINTLLREPPNSREASEALLGIRDSATFLLFGGEWGDFFERVLGWSPAEGLRIKKLYEERRWAEVELQQVDVQAGGIKSHHRADMAPATSRDSQEDPEKRPSETAPLAGATSNPEPMKASPCGVTAASEKTQPSKEKKVAAAPAPSRNSGPSAFAATRSFARKQPQDRISVSDPSTD